MRKIRNESPFESKVNAQILDSTNTLKMIYINFFHISISTFKIPFLNKYK